MTETRLRSESPEAEIEAEQFTARWEAAAFEGSGEVINEHYSRQEYVKRRVHFLGQHPEWKHHSQGLFAATRVIAQEVFVSDDKQLSVQELQRREIACGVVPLLPLPTTANTETLDAFHGYPQSEWTPAPVSAPKISKTGTTASRTRPANTSMTVNKAKQTSAEYLSDLSATGEESMPSFSSSRNIMSHEQSTNANGSSSAMTNELTPYPGGRTAPSEAEKVDQILTQLGRPGWENELYKSEKNDSSNTQMSSADTAPMEVIVGAGVSALANRGMDVPVKSRAKRAGTPLSAVDEASEPDDHAGESSSQKAPAKKKLKPGKGSGKSGHTAAAPKKRTTSNKSQESADSQSKASWLEGVVLGTELPRSQEDAAAAAGIRYDRLLAEHNAGMRASKRKATPKSKKQHPDFQPEFFKTENFIEGQEEDSVRCICGVCVDDNQKMVACDDCSVWQHVACMGEAVPEDVENEGYLCHVCDPWAHRVSIAHMRRGHSLNG